MRRKMNSLFCKNKIGNSDISQPGCYASRPARPRHALGATVLLLLMLAMVRPSTCQAVYGSANPSPCIRVNNKGCEPDKGCEGASVVPVEDQQSGGDSASGAAPGGAGAAASSLFAPVTLGGAPAIKYHVNRNAFADLYDPNNTLAGATFLWEFMGPALGCEFVGFINTKAVIVKLGKDIGAISLRVSATLLDGTVLLFTRTVRLESQLLNDSSGCSSCGDNGILALGGAGIGNNKGPDFQMRLGRDSNWEDSGIIQLKASTPSALLATPDALKLPYYNPDAQTKFHPSSGALQQIKSAQGFVTNEIFTPYKYEMRVYDNTQVTGTGFP
jgi:hypothetical protein